MNDNRFTSPPSSSAFAAAPSTNGNGHAGNGHDAHQRPSKPSAAATQLPAAVPASPPAAAGPAAHARPRKAKARPDRDDEGRYTRGNPGGPGNPYARQVAKLRSRLIQSVTDEDFDEVAAKLIELAKGGDVPAIKLFLSYLIGKPTAPPAEPDDLDVHEMQHFEAEGRMLETATPLLTKPDPALPLTMLREARPHVTADQAAALYGVVSLPAKEQAKVDAAMQGMSPAERVAKLRELGRTALDRYGANPGSRSTNGKSAARAKGSLTPKHLRRDKRIVPGF